MTISVDARAPVVARNGVPAGTTYKFDISTTKADPSSGYIRFNNATLASVTELYIDDLNAGGADVSDWIDSFDEAASTVKCRIQISKLSAPDENFVLFKMTGTSTDESGYWSVSSLTAVVSAGSFEQDDEIGVTVFWGNEPGSAGENGDIGGVAEFQWSTGTSGDPTSGYVGVDNATYSSATVFRASETDRNSDSVANILARIDDATNANGKCVCRVQAEGNSAKWIAFNVTSNETDNGGWKNWTFTYLNSGGTAIAADDVVWLSIFPSGSDGGGSGDLVSTNNLSDVANAGTARSNLGLSIGSDVQAHDADLDAISGLTSAADRIPYYTGSGTAALAIFTSAGRALVDDASTSAQRTTLGLGTGATLDETTAAQYRNNTADKLLSTDQVWTAAEEVTLTDAATIAVDMDTFINAVVTLGGNRALGNPTNEKVGQSGLIRVVQDGTGSRTLSFGTDYEFAGGTAPTLTTTASAEDLLFYKVLASNRVFISSALDIS